MLYQYNWYRIYIYTHIIYTGIALYTLVKLNKKHTEKKQESHDAKTVHTIECKLSI